MDYTLWPALLSEAGTARLHVLEEENRRLHADGEKQERVIQDLTAENRERRAQVQALSQHLARMKKEHYGPKRGTAAAPKAAPASAPPPSPVPVAGTTEVDPAVRRRGQRRGANGHGRHLHTELPTEDVVHLLPPGLETCPRCHLPRTPMASEDRSEEITFAVIVKRRRIHHRPRYRTACQCKDVPKIVTPHPPPKVIPKGKVSPEFRSTSACATVMTSCPRALSSSIATRRNVAERALRGPVVGRENFYGSGSVQSAKAAANLWTLFATCKRNGANGLALLTAYLRACAEARGQPPSDPAPLPSLRPKRRGQGALCPSRGCRQLMMAT